MSCDWSFPNYKKRFGGWIFYHVKAYKTCITLCSVVDQNQFSSDPNFANPSEDPDKPLKREPVKTSRN